MATQKGRNWSSGDIVTAANLQSVERGVSAVSSSYEPTTWANGDTVTAAALNNIEQGIVNADGGGKTWVTLCEEEVTTAVKHDYNMAQLSYSQLISADTIRVTFDGNEYICDVNNTQEFYGYGGFTQTGPDFSEYPFIVVSGMSGSPPNVGVVNQITTETSGTHTVKIEALQESSSSDFSIAKVTITVMPNVTEEVDVIIPYIDESYLELQSTLVGGDSFTIDAVNYKEGSRIFLTQPASALSGNIEDIGNIIFSSISLYAYCYTGDCTIIISGSSSVEEQ